MYYIYVLQSQGDNNLYIGITKNIKKRLFEHNSGKNLSTKYRIPFRLIFSEAVKDRKIARVREKYLKSGCGREWIKQKYMRL